MPCPHCGEAVEEGQGVCPNCGALLEGIWPPPPEGTAAPSHLPRPKTKTLKTKTLKTKTLTGGVWTDFLLGAAAQYLTHLATARVLAGGLPPADAADVQGLKRATASLFMVTAEMFWAVVFGLLLYFGARWFYPSVARGSGYATLALMLVLLGAFFTCRPVPY